MSEAMHTPGPWTIAADIHNGRIGIASKHGAVVTAPFNQAQVYGVQGQANGRLIAAAPDMLEALRDCMAVIEVLVAIHGPDPAGASLIALNKGDLAIAKATGA